MGVALVLAGQNASATPEESPMTAADPGASAERTLAYGSPVDESWTVETEKATSNRLPSFSSVTTPGRQLSSRSDLVVVPEAPESGQADLLFFEPNKNSVAASWRVEPIAKDSEAVSFEANYLGRDSTAEDGGVPGQRVWGVAGDARLLSESFTMHAEYANGGDYAVDPAAAGGAAYTYSARYQGDEETLLNKTLNWGVKLEHAAAAASFWGPAAYDFPLGRAVDRGVMNMNWGRLDAGLTQERLTDFPGTEHTGSEDLSRTRTNLRYQPQANVIPNGLSWLMANPQIGMSHTVEAVTIADADSIAGRGFRSTRAQLRFEPATWAWELEHAFSFLDQRAPSVIDQSREETVLRFDIPLSANCRFRPSFRWVDVSLADDRSGDEFYGALEGQFSFMPQRVSTWLKLEAESRVDAYSGDPTDRIRTEGWMRWNAIPQVGTHLGVRFSLRGVYEHIDAQAGTVANYEAHASVEVYWPDGS